MQRILINPTISVPLHISKISVCPLQTILVIIKFISFSAPFLFVECNEFCVCCPFLNADELFWKCSIQIPGRSKSFKNTKTLSCYSTPHPFPHLPCNFIQDKDGSCQASGVPPWAQHFPIYKRQSMWGRPSFLIKVPSAASIHNSCPFPTLIALSSECSGPLQ